MPYAPYVSENGMYGRGKNGRTFLNPSARKWRTDLQLQVEQWVRDNGIVVRPGTPVIVNLTAHFPPRGGKGRGRKQDVFDYNKLPNDGIAKGLGIDDNVFVG